MEDVLDALHRLGGDARVTDVAFDHLQPRRGRKLRQILALAGGKIIQHAHEMPCSSRAATMCEPMKPAPPVTR